MSNLRARNKKVRLDKSFHEAFYDVQNAWIELWKPLTSRVEKLLDWLILGRWADK